MPMAKKKSQENGLPDGVPAFLADAVARAKAARVPTPTEEDSEAFPLLWEMLAPSVLWAGSGEGGTAKKEVLREPMASIYWDGRAGTWLLTVRDKVLKVNITCSVRTLLTAFQDAENHLKAGTFTPSLPRKRS
jgi:hypothetical protein